MTTPDEEAAPGEQGSWRSIAENLFGIEFSQPEDSVESDEELIFDEYDDAVETVDESLPATVSPSSEFGAVADEGVSNDDSVAGTDVDSPVDLSLEFEDDADDDQAASDSFETDDGPSVEFEGAVETADNEDAVAAGTNDGDAPDKDDSFWNALDDWEWDEDRQKPASHGREKTERVTPDTRRRATEARPRAPAPYRSEDTIEDDVDVVDDAFGLGVLDSEKQAESSPASDQHSDRADGPPERRPRRRRRRRRRPREGERKVAEAPADLEGDDDGFVAGLDDVDAESAEKESEAVEAKPRRAPRRRGRRRRNRPESDEAAASVSTEIKDDSDDEDADETQDVEGSDETQDVEGSDEPSPDDASPYGNVPTWEEAISYLVQPVLGEQRRRGSGPRRRGSGPRRRGPRPPKQD